MFDKKGDVVWGRLWFSIIDFWQSITIDNFYCYRFLIPIDKNWSVLSTDFRYQSISIDDAWKYTQSDCLSIITHSYSLSRWVGMTIKNLLKHNNVTKLLACITFSDIFIAVNLIRFVPTIIVTIASPILMYALAIVAGKLIWPACLVSCLKKRRN